MDNETLREILELQKESCVRDTELNAKLDNMNNRMVMLENLTAEMSKTLNEQKHLRSVVDTLTNTVNQNRNEIESLRHELDEQKSRSALAMYGFLKKASWIAAQSGIVALAGYLIYKFKAIWNGGAE